MDDVLQFTRQTANIFPLLAWSAAFLGLLAVALALPRPRLPLASQNRRNLVALPLYALIAIGAATLILGAGVRPIQADVAFKMTNPYDHSREWELAIPLYEQAIELAPREDFYYLFLGRAQLEQARAEQNPARRETQLAQALETLEHAQALNHLNPDHVANLARFHNMTANLETGAAARETHLRAADSYYAEALAFAPQNVLLLNEWAMLQWHLHGETQACRLLERSLELDPGFEPTQQQYADVCSQALPDRPQSLDFED
jgi:tetratricopeptide (TPR) repeat protein